MFIPRRLDKYLRDTTAWSLVAIRQACVAGRVTVLVPSAASPASSPPDWLVFEDDVVALDGAPIVPRTHHHYLVLNKPRAITTTASDPKGRSDLTPWLRVMPDGVFPVGRLDRDTSGALIFTDDGDFANAILQPGHHTQKLYALRIEERLSDDDPRLGAFVAGVKPHPGRAALRAICATVHRRTEGHTEVHVTLDQGKNRQIRKMCKALGLRLLELHRTAVGSLRIDDLASGQWRQLRADEVAGLWSSSGGMERVARNKIAALAKTAQISRVGSAANHRLVAWLQRFGPGASHTACLAGGST